MCGGRGTRLDSPHEKPLHPIDGTPMIDRVLGALATSRVETIYAAVSPNAPATRTHVAREHEDATLIETPGDGYVDDLLCVLAEEAVSTPVLTVAADLPLLDGPIVDRVLGAYDAHRGDDASMTVCVPAAFKERLGVSVDARLEGAAHLAPTGVNVVGDAESSERFVADDRRLAVNVNRLDDARIATRLLRSTDTNHD